MDYVLDFGKHKGKNLGSLTQTDDGVGYIDWLLKQPDINKKPHYKYLVDVWNTLGKQLPEKKDENIIQFGSKYKGKHVDEVIKDIPYITWVINQPFFQFQPDIIKHKFREAIDESKGASGFALISEEPITFGKYRGLKSSDLLKDTEYCKFLAEKDWFKTNPLYKMVIKALENPQLVEENNKANTSSSTKKGYASQPGVFAFDPLSFGCGVKKTEPELTKFEFASTSSNNQYDEVDYSDDW